MQNEKTRRTLLRLLCLLLTAALLWRWQRIFYLCCADYIRSDMPAHVALALSHSDYGLSSYLIRALWALFGPERGQTLLSLCLTANQLLGLGTLWLLLRALFPETDGAALYLAALLAHVCGPWILPGQTQMYLGVYNGNLFHNMTLLFSRSFVPLALLFFCRLWDARRGGLSPWDAAGLTLSLLLATAFKPSFLAAFAPVVFCLLLADFAQTRARGFGREFLIGACFLPALGVMLWASSVLYAEDFAGESSSMALKSWTLAAFLGALVMYLRGLLLPLYTFGLQGRRETALRGRFGILWLTNLAAIAEALLLTETGFRENDGNFDWGALALYPVTMGLSIALLWRMFRAEDRRTSRGRLRLACGVVLLLGHLLTGLYCLARPGHAGYDWFYF